jgi:hypoxanthine phosphoribosyltransferase
LSREHDTETTLPPSREKLIFVRDEDCAGAFRTNHEDARFIHRTFVSQHVIPIEVKTKPAVPVRWRSDVERVLITDQQLARRIGTMARQIERDFRGREMVVVSLLNGTVMFLADMIRHLSLPLRLDFMGVSSYGAGTESGQLVFTKELRIDVRGRDVLLVDDILDTGRTLSRVIPKLQALKPRRIKVCVLLDKPSRRIEKVKADYVGFKIPDFFVVGYGLDFAEKYRNLPFVGVLHSHIYKQDIARVIPMRRRH